MWSIELQLINEIETVGKLIRNEEQIKRNRRVIIKAKWNALLIEYY